MWKALIYKEWLKIRWFVIGFTALGLISTGYVFLKVQHDMEFTDRNNYWYSILFQGHQYFAYLKFVPLAAGLTIGIAQYLPETGRKRLKLSFHLPLKENKTLLIMQLFGTGSLLLAQLLVCGLFLALSAVFFPSEIVREALVALTPWFLAGFAAHFLAALVILEPVWKYRFFYFLVSALFITVYFLAMAYAGINQALCALTASLGFAFMFSAYRFRKGEM